MKKALLFVLMIILTMSISGCAKKVKETATQEYRTIPAYTTYVIVSGKTTYFIPIVHPEHKERKYIVTYSDGTKKEIWRDSGK